MCLNQCLEEDIRLFVGSVMYIILYKVIHITNHTPSALAVGSEGRAWLQGLLC